MELRHAELVLALADRWHQTPATILREPVETLRLLKIAQRGGMPDGEHH